MIGFNTNINIPEWFCLFACEELCSKVHCYWYLCHLINDDIINPYCIGDWCSLVILISIHNDSIQCLYIYVIKDACTVNRSLNEKNLLNIDM